MWGREKETGVKVNTVAKIGGVWEEVSQSKILQVRTMGGMVGSSPVATAEHGGFQNRISRDSRGPGRLGQ